MTVAGKVLELAESAEDGHFVGTFELTEREVAPWARRGLLEVAVILIGDSGEKDPEVYGTIARERAPQIRRIYIRDVTNEAATAKRYEVAFDGVPRDKWVVFQDATKLPPAP